MLNNALGAIAVAGLATSASATDAILDIDLSTTDTIVITATGGAATANASAADFLGVLVADFFGAPLVSSLSDTLVSGDLTSANEAADSDGTPDLFGASGNAGLNIWSLLATSGMTFTSGSAAFAGSGEWTIDSDSYAAAFAAGNRKLEIYAAADTDDDIAGATFIGYANVTVPAPTSMALLGLGGLVAVRRRR